MTTFLVLIDKRTGLFFDGGYMRKKWSPTPRLFKSTSGLKNAIDMHPREINPEWFAKYTKGNPEPEYDPLWNSEHGLWRKRMWVAWSSFKSKNKIEDVIGADFCIERPSIVIEK